MRIEEDPGPPMRLVLTVENAEDVNLLRTIIRIERVKEQQGRWRDNVAAD